MSMSALPFSFTRRCRPTVPPAPSRLNTSMPVAISSSSITRGDRAGGRVVPAAGGVRDHEPQAGDRAVARRRRGRAALGGRAAAGEHEPGGNGADGELPQGSSAHCVPPVCPAGSRRLTAKVASAVARVTLACALSFVVVVSTVRRGGACAALACVRSARRQEKHVSRRLSLAGQLLALQVVIICVVLVGVTAVTVAQSTSAPRRSRAAGRRPSRRPWPTRRALRDAVDRGTLAYIRVAAETTRNNSGSASVVVARPDRKVLASADPERAAPALRHRRQHRPRAGRGWVGERQVDGTPAAVAMAPILTGPRRDRRRLRRGHPALSRVLDGLRGRGAEPAHLPGPGQRDRHRRLAAGGPAGEAADARPGAGARSPAWSSTATRCCTASARASSGSTSRGRVTLINDEAIRLLRHPRRRPRPDAGRARGGGGDARRAAHRRRSSATAPWPAPAGCWWSTGCRSPAAAGRSAR